MKPLALLQLDQEGSAYEMRGPSGPKLTPRERDCMQAIAQGLRIDAVANRLKIMPVTVELHLRNARGKLGAQTLPQAVALALRSGLIEHT